MTPLMVENEIAYDLLQDNLELILRLIESPLPRAAVVEQVGSERAVARLERYGLIRATSRGMEAVSSTYQQMRQEGMVSFLDRYVLPSLSATAHASPTTHLLDRFLDLEPSARADLLRGPVQRFFEELSAAADAPLRDPGARLSVLVIGADEVGDDALDSVDAALLHLQSASRLRAASETRDRAVLSQFDCIADHGRFEAIVERMGRFIDALAPESVPPERANYRLMVASHWRIADPQTPEGALQ